MEGSKTVKAGTKLTTILFALDGTLLPIDNKAFTKGYFSSRLPRWLPTAMKRIRKQPLTEFFR